MDAKNEVVGVVIVSGAVRHITVKKEEVITAFSAGMKIAHITRMEAFYLSEVFKHQIWKRLSKSKTLFCVDDFGKPITGAGNDN